MTTPTVLPTGFDGTNKDYLKVKRDNSGAVRLEVTELTIPDATTTGVLMGLVPFQKGFRLSYGSQLYISDVDTATTVTLNAGYAYKTGSTETDDPDAFVSAVTTAQGGGLITFDEEEGIVWVAADDGWIVLQFAAGSSNEAGTATGQILGAYDGLGVTN